MAKNERGFTGVRIASELRLAHPYIYSTDATLSVGYDRASRLYMLHITDQRQTIKIVLNKAQVKILRRQLKQTIKESNNDQ